MPINSVLLQYQAKLQEIQTNFHHLRSGQTTALAVMVAAGVIVLVFSFLAWQKRAWGLWCSPLPLAAIAFSGRKYVQNHSGLYRLSRLKRYYERGLARVENRWAGTGFGGEQFQPFNHPYAGNLTLFGEGSLFELLCTSRTDIGRHRLANYLLETPDLDEVRERQKAVQELKNRTDLFEQVALLGKFDFQESNRQTFAEWLEIPVFSVHPIVRFMVLSTSVMLAVFMLLGFDAVMDWSHLWAWVVPLLAIHGVLALVFRRRVAQLLPAVRSVGLEMKIITDGLHLLRSQKFESEKLRRIAECSKTDDLLRAFHKLERLTNALLECDKEWFYPFSRLLLVNTQLLLAVERWKLQNADLLRASLAAWGEFEALVALALYAYEHPENAFPEFVADDVVFEAQGLGHPLLPHNDCVRNEIALNTEKQFYLISGSNMSGKSTLLRTLGVNAVLAYAGAPVRAKQIRLSLFSVCASLAVVDSLLNGKSKFLVEMDRLRQAIEFTNGSRPVLFLIDEILSGTNSRDRRVATEAIIRTLIGGGALGVISTHDLTLTEIPDLDGFSGMNVHMGSKNSSDPLNFDYLLKIGPSTESNALAIARMAGVLV